MVVMRKAILNVSKLKEKYFNLFPHKEIFNNSELAVSLLFCCHNQEQFNPNLFHRKR